MAFLAACVLAIAMSDSVARADDFPDTPQKTLFVMNADGTDLRLLVRPEGFDSAGSPSFTSDGTMIAFDAWNRAAGQSGNQARIYVVNADGTGLKDLGDGCMPTWSPRGQRLCFCRYEPHGVWVMRDDGSERQLLDAQGWGAQWSPNGHMIAYTKSDAAGQTIAVYDLVEDDYFTLWSDLKRGERPYSQIYWNMTWSPDSTRLCFKGTSSDGNQEQIGLLTVLKRPTESKLRYAGVHYADFAWHPDGKRIVFTKTSPERKRQQLYEFNPDNDDEPTLVAGQPADRQNMDVCWSPDGNRLVFASMGVAPPKAP